MIPEIKVNIILAPYTIYKIGGAAKFFSEVRNSEELKKVLFFVEKKNLPFFIMGAGSNILINDNGFDGLLIHMSGGALKIDGVNLIADAGVMMARAVTETAKAGLTGFEWAIGIPGTIGGSVRGNAGCFGGEIKDVIESVEVFDSRTLKVHKLNQSECLFGYRDSIFKAHPEWVILSAILRLSKDSRLNIEKNIMRITSERVEKQDIGNKSCGCIFKNVLWKQKDINKEKIIASFSELEQFHDKAAIPASYLIDRSYLKGKRVGHAVVSSKHANYFVNDGGATAEQVVILIGIVKDAVRRKFGILLEEEIQYVGF